jgi:hypothetical protein
MRPSLHWSLAQRAIAQAPDWQSALTLHTFVAPHFGSQLPPQSTSVSVPFLRPSKHASLTQRIVVALQTPEAQSTPAVQRWFTAQRLLVFIAPQVPPQSTSDSLPAVSTPSSHGPAAHCCSVVLQRFEVQSPLAVQRLPLAQRAVQVAPPQSTSDSAPLRTRSWHASEMQRLPTQRFDAQSRASVQLRPVAHALGQLPPQSRSASVVSFTPFSHALPTHRPPLHTFEVQSVLALQLFESPHLRQVGPPQSMLDSLPLSTPSPQPGGSQRRVVALHTALVTQSP